MLVGQCLVLRLDLVLQLSDLVRGNFEFALKFSDLILSLDKVLGVKVTVGAHRLVQVLLLLKFPFKLDILLLELRDQVFLQLHFFNHLHQVGVSLGGFMRELIPLFLEFRHILKDSLKSSLGPLHVIHKFLILSELLDQVFLGGLVLFLGPLDADTHLVPVVLQSDDVLLLAVDLLAEELDLAGECRHTALREVLFVDGLHLFAGETVFLVGELRVDERDLTVALLQHFVLVGVLTQGLVQLV